MRQFLRGGAILILCVAPFASGGVSVAAPPAKVKLTVKQISLVKEEIIPTYRAGDPKTILTLLSAQVGKLTDGHLASIDELLAEEKLPPVEKMLTDARMSFVLQGLADKLPPPAQREYLLLAAELKRQIDDTLTECKKLPLMQEPLPQPKTIKEFRDLFWVAHVQENELLNATQLVAYGLKLSKSGIKSSAKNLTDEQREILNIKFSDVALDVAKVKQDLFERTLELRLKRLDLANKILAESGDIKERFFAAYAVGVDGPLLFEGFRTRDAQLALQAVLIARTKELEEKTKGKKDVAGKKEDTGKEKEVDGKEVAAKGDDKEGEKDAKPTADKPKTAAVAALPAFGREALNKPGLSEEIKQKVETGFKNGGKLIEKSQMLFVGLHWWRRGRYGLGVEAGGLLKSKDALRTADAQIALFMPRLPPTPTDPMKDAGEQFPKFDRRHHYIWAWRDREFSMSSLGSGPSSTTASSPTTSGTHTSYFY